MNLKNQRLGGKIMKKALSAILSLLITLSLFSSCGKDNKTEDNNTESSTSQTTPATTEELTETENTTKPEDTTTASDTTTVSTTENKNKTEKNNQNKDKENTKETGSSKPSQGSSEQTRPSLKVANTDLLVGSWAASFIANGVTAKMTFTFDFMRSSVRAYFSSDNYECMIDQIIENELSKITDEEIAESEYFSDRDEAREYLHDILTQEIPYSSLSSQLNRTGSWKLQGDTLTINFSGEIYTAETRLSDDIATFVLVGPSGDRITLTKC